MEAAAAKSLQSCPTLCDPMDFSLPGFYFHGILQARTLAWVAISFSNMYICVCVYVYVYVDVSVYMGFPGGSVVKNLPAMRETWV